MKKRILCVCLATLPAASFAQSGVMLRGSYAEFKPLYANNAVKLKTYGGGLGIKLRDVTHGMELVAGIDYHTGSKATVVEDGLKHQLDSAWQLTTGSRYLMGSSFYLLAYTSILYYDISSEQLQAGKWVREQKAFSGYDLIWGLGLGFNLSQSIGIEASSTVLNKHKVVDFSLFYQF